MKSPFNPAEGLIHVSARVFGNNHVQNAKLALDTGASRTVLRPELLEHLGYSPKTALRKINITTGSRVETGVEIGIKKLSALGRVKRDMTIVTHSLPIELKVDGILGLDFFRGRKLKIDFRKGLLSLK